MGCDCSNQSPDKARRMDGTVPKMATITIPLREYCELVAASNELNELKGGCYEGDQSQAVNENHSCGSCCQ